MFDVSYLEVEDLISITKLFQPRRPSLPGPFNPSIQIDIDVVMPGMGVARTYSLTFSMALLWILFLLYAMYTPIVALNPVK